MAVFVAFGDETERGDQTGPFAFGGWVAPSLYWLNSFTPEWERRILRAHPPLETLHMTNLASPEWRQAHGWSDSDANKRVNEAIQVIKNARVLRPVVNRFDGQTFRDVFGKTQVIQQGKQPGTYKFEPDYIGFLGFAVASLELVHARHRDAEKVDFVIERKQYITHHIEKDFYPNIEQALAGAGRESLLSLVGELIPSDKSRAPLQAADVLLWHYRRVISGEATDIDERRFKAIERTRRAIAQTGMPRRDIREFGKRSIENAAPNPFQPKRGRGRSS